MDMGDVSPVVKIAAIAAESYDGSLGSYSDLPSRVKGSDLTV
jgi:hypothetical protein